MISRLKKDKINPKCQEFCKKLDNEPIFKGEIRTDLATRISVATDNSIYQKIPTIVIFPKSHIDIALIITILQNPKFKDITITARGGGTGTNGQSITGGVLLDTSKYMAKIIKINDTEQWAEIEPGVVLDQLNTALKPKNLFFAPHVSPSSHATIGGMLNTDASGKGSAFYGKTSDHILELITILGNGESIAIQKNQKDQIKRKQKKLTETELELNKTLQKIGKEHAGLIKKQDNHSLRPVTGYNLKESIPTNKETNLIKLFCGSEGTLGITTKIKVKLTKLPTQTTLAIVGYESFEHALADAISLNRLKPIAIESIDESVVTAAKTDPIYLEMIEKISKNNLDTINSYNFIEFHKKTISIAKSTKRKSITVIKDPNDIKTYWEIRKNAVGLAAKLISSHSKQPNRQPIPFIEDTVVDPNQLPAYIKELRQLLDKFDLKYSMYGHADVGCIHVRPALNLQSKEDQALIRPITTEVIKLVQKYNGIFWGEHSKGYKAELQKSVIGPELYESLKEIKQVCDPKEKLNPGKIVTLSEKYALKIDQDLRGTIDNQIHPSLQNNIRTAINCNGNGKCFDQSPETIMCPSSKATKDRIHSPKGRAAILREWYRLQTKSGALLLKSNSKFTQPIKKCLSLILSPLKFITYPLKKLVNSVQGDDYNHEVYAAMKGCLQCKACVGQCPVNIDIPHYVSEFYDHYHTRYNRPLRDYFLYYYECILPILSRFPNLSNAITHSPFSKTLLTLFQLTPPPKLPTESIYTQLKSANITPIKPKAIKPTTQKTLHLIPDPFTYHYEPKLWVDTVQLIEKIGDKPLIIKYFPTGKSAHVKGFLKEFKAITKKNMNHLAPLISSKAKLSTLEPSIMYLFKTEYQKATQTTIPIKTIQEHILDILTKNSPKPTKTESKQYYLLSHCTEASMGYNENKLWQTIFETLGYSLKICEVGCCGMAGNYGHETEHKDLSKDIFEHSWAPIFETVNDYKTIMATGFSCREQVQAQLNRTIQHPIQILNSLL